MIEASKNGDLDKVRSSLVEIFLGNRRVIGKVLSISRLCRRRTTCKHCLVILYLSNLRTFSVIRFVTFQVIPACIGKKYVSY